MLDFDFFFCSLLKFIVEIQNVSMEWPLNLKTKEKTLMDPCAWCS